MNGKTKIVCTLGPSSRSEETLVRLIRSGMDVVRLNFSHGTYDDHLTALSSIQRATRKTGGHVAVIQDLQGPKIRIGELGVPAVELTPGARFTITTKPILGSIDIVSTGFADLPSDVRPGDPILIDDGKIRLRVVTVHDTDVVCEVIVGGVLASRKGINLPGVAVGTPSITEKDVRDLEFGIEHDIDYVALSFVRTADDIRALRAAIVQRIGKGRFLPIIAKVEKPQAVANIDAIIAEADGIMVARGDLGVELPPEDVPVVQKMIIKKCNRAGKLVIIATQMLESMIGSPSPTRAEVSDVANAVIDGGDALMLSGETSVGKYPVEAVQIMERIIQRVESEHIGPAHALESAFGGVESRHDALGRAACVLAEQMNAAAIVAVTRSGETARVVSRYRPRTSIVAITDRTEILRRLNLIWGIHGMLIERLNDDSDTTLQKIQESLVKSGLVQRGQYVVLLAGQPFLAQGSTNFVKVEKVT
jgi:pyruvate kinase